jgi:hypothetical protein
MSWGRAVLVTVALALVVPAAGSAADAPPGFFGVVPQAQLTGVDFARMKGTVETVRMPIFWFECEPRAGKYDFAAVDAEVGAAAARGIRVLPFVYGTPSWVNPVQAHAPHSAAALAKWKGFLRVLVARYGPGGAFWRGRSHKQPIRRWQIWNEPNFRLYWEPRVEPDAYAKLLHASAISIRHGDPGAQIVLAGIAPVGAGMKTWVFMRRLLRFPDVLRDFDFAADHPYSATIPELDYQLEKVRAAMVAGGAGRKPLLITEFGVASSGAYPSAFVLGEEGQASFLRRSYARLLQMRRRWRIDGAYWYTWQDEAIPDVHCSFCQGAGLFRRDGNPKLAWSAYRRVVAQ